MPWLLLKDETGQPVEGEIIDISEGGLCLRVVKALGSGSILTLVIRDKDLRAIVKWCRFVKDENAFHCGLEILDDTTKLLEEIAKVWSIGD